MTGWNWITMLNDVISMFLDNNVKIRLWDSFAYSCESTCSYDILSFSSSSMARWVNSVSCLFGALLPISLIPRPLPLVCYIWQAVDLLSRHAHRFFRGLLSFACPLNIHIYIYSRLQLLLNVFKLSQVSEFLGRLSKSSYNGVLFKTKYLSEKSIVGCND